VHRQAVITALLRTAVRAGNRFDRQNILEVIVF
jgi:hypothetical protein